MLVSNYTAMAGYYDYGDVARSVLIAIAASYAALDLAGRVTAARGRARLGWLSGGALAMGIGIWATHFKGMLAFHLPVPVKYHWPTVLASLWMAIFASAFALYAASRETTGRVRALTGGVMMGGGIAGMHYIGMAAMRLPAITRYSPLLVTCSILLAILFSLIALLMAFGLREEARWSIPRRLASAILMGIAVSAMHYTGMAAASFLPASPPDFSHAVSIPPFGNFGVVIATLLVLVVAIVTSAVDRRASAEIQRLNQDLGRRVADRTAQLEEVNRTLREEIAERQRAEEALRQSEDHLRLVIDTIPQQIWSCPPDGALDFCNAQFRSYVGLTLEQLQGDGWQRMLHPDDLERVVKAWRGSVMKGTAFEQEARDRGDDGQYRWFLVRGVPLRDARGRIVRWYITSTNIEDRKRAEDRLRLVVDTTPALLYSARPDGGLDFFNKRWLDYLGLPLEEILGWGWTAAIHPEDVEGILAKWRSSLATGEPYEAEARVRRSDGEYRWMILRKLPARDGQGNIVKWYGSSVDIEDRKRAEEELKRSEAKHRVIVEAASDAVISMDESGSVLVANPATGRIFGYDPAELIGKPLTVLMPEFMRKLHQAGFRRYLATGERHLNWQGTEVTALRKSGQEFPVEVSFGEMTSNGHRVFTGFIRDISEKKRAEDELRKQKEIFQKIFEHIPVMIAFFSTDGSIELVNPEWERTTGWTLQEIRERNLDIFAELYPDPQYRQMARNYVVLSTGGRAEFEVRVRDGRVIDMAADAVKLSDGSTLGIGRDVTARKRAEAELRESEARFRLVADSAPVMIWMSGTDKLCTYFNKPWLDFTGRSIDRELGKGWAERVEPEDLQRCLDTYNRAFDRREAFRVEYQLRRHDGEYRLVSDIGVPRFSPDGSFAGYIGSCIDVTEQRRAEEQLRQAQEDLSRVTRIVAMGELAAAIAHEVNQPLTAIVTNANFSLRQLNSATPDPDELRGAITEIVNDGARASAVISRIRGLLMSGAPRAIEVDLNQVVRDVILLLRYELNRNRISLRTELAPGLPAVQGDPVQLQQVLINLIMNAIDALRMSGDRPREILIRSAKNPEGILVQIEDSGPGVRPEQGNRIFEPFFTTKPQGIGMGLSISRSIVESHGGRLWAAPGELHGARFQFTVPMADTSDEPAA